MLSFSLTRTLLPCIRSILGSILILQTKPSKMRSTRTRRLHAAGRTVRNWFRRAGRDFPWRKERDPFWVLVAEILLRKTRASNVLPVYSTFRLRFPTPGDVAKADIRKLRSIIAPIGLPRRAQTIRKAAALSAGGDNLASAETLRQLDGVGDYISSAVRCLCATEPAPMVDGGVTRVISRVGALKGPFEARLRSARKLVGVMLEAAPPRSVNLGLLDIAATICTKSPRCSVCPLRRYCGYYRANIKRRRIPENGSD